MGLKGEDMKRYDFTSDDTCHSGCGIEEFEDGQYVKWEDVKGIENLGFELHDGYIRVKGVANQMAVSLHQRFDINAATLRFKIKDSESLIIDIDQDAFEKFMNENDMTTIPWYLRWWYWLKMRRIYRGKI